MERGWKMASIAPATPAGADCFGMATGYSEQWIVNSGQWAGPAEVWYKGGEDALRRRRLSRHLERSRYPARADRRPGPGGGPSLAPRARPLAVRRGGAARRLLLRRLPAHGGHRPLLAGHGGGGGARRGWQARHRHLQRLPAPLRGSPAARRLHAQRLAPVPLRLGAPARRERGDAVHAGLPPWAGPADTHLPRRGTLRCRRGDAGYARIGRAGRVPLLRRGRRDDFGGEPERERERHRRHRQRARQRPGDDAASGAGLRAADGRGGRPGALAVPAGLGGGESVRRWRTSRYGLRATPANRIDRKSVV